VNGKMIGGFAVIAYPADYRSSGVMTFIVNQSGVIYQKDFGRRNRRNGERDDGVCARQNMGKGRVDNQSGCYL
jgi:Protein of unknown function (DUF2950)